MRPLRVIILSSFSLVACASRQIATEIIEQRVENNSAIETVKNSTLAPKEKAQVTTALENSNKRLTDCGNDNAKKDEQVMGITESRDWWRALAFKLMGATLIAILGCGLIWKLK